jgi:hypothetical protein
MDTEPTDASETLPRIRRGARLMALVGTVQIISSIHFLFVNFSDQFLERGLSLEQVGVTKAQIRAFNPDLVNYVSHLHIAIAGYGMALGLAAAALAWFGIQRGLRWAWWAAVTAIFIAAAVGLPAHFFYNLTTIGHLGPPFALLTVFAIGAAMSYPSSASLHPKRPNRAFESGRAEERRAAQRER